MKKLILSIIALGSLSLLSFDKIEVKSDVKAYTAWIAYCSNGKVLRFTCDCSQESANHFANALCSRSSN